MIQEVSRPVFSFPEPAASLYELTIYSFPLLGEPHAQGKRMFKSFGLHLAQGEHPLLQAITEQSSSGQCPR
jgi:hypothetical protein